MVIENFITIHVIEYLNKNFEESVTEKRQKYLKIFRAFCIVNDKAITKNQTDILNCFIKKREGTMDSFNFKL